MSNICINAGHKRGRCGECSPCKKEDCGKCIYCLDMKKFGGPGQKKKCCLEKRCTSLVSTTNTSASAKSKQETCTTFYKPLYLLEQKRKAYHIAKDGNCLYRAVSYAITGDQENYSSLKLLLERFENFNSELFSGLLLAVNKQTMREHLRHMGMPNTWGTHIELFAAATYFNIPVYTFIVDPTNLRWEVFKPLKSQNLCYPVTVDNEDELFIPPSHIELLYYPDKHYDSIVDLDTEVCSTTTPQITITDHSQVIQL